MSKKSGFVGALLGGSTELYIAIAVVLMVFMLIFPLPTMVLDFLMVCNIVLSLIILLSVLYLKRPIDFGTFPTMLLISTVFSFALNEYRLWLLQRVPQGPLRLRPVLAWMQ